MNNPTQHQNPALRIEAGSINCLLVYVSCYAANRNLLTIAESLTAHYVEYLLLLRLIVLTHLTRRNAQRITMITDGRGNVIAGGNEAWILKCFAFCHLALRLRLPVAISLLFEAPIGGKSHISYTPYGSIHRTDSSGPDITKFKYTGQEEDKESGLMYYKARYYDPMVGRFLQADSVAFPDRVMGMNRYMYTEGSPVNYRDPSGHANVSHMFGQIFKHMTGAATSIKNAGKTYSTAVYGKNHNEKALTHGSAFARNAERGARFGLAIMNPGLSMLIQPMFTLGFYYSSLMFVWSMIANAVKGRPQPYVTYHNGGYAMENMNLPHRAAVWAPFAMLPTGTTHATKLHEYGHLEQ